MKQYPAVNFGLNTLGAAALALLVSGAARAQQPSQTPVREAGKPAAQGAAKPAPQKPQAQKPADVPGQLPAELTDPAMADKLARVMQALSKSFLDLPVGEVEAALEGRPATAADRKRTVRTEGRKDDPNFERNLQQQMANAQPMMRDAMKALVSALPAMMQSMGTAAKELEKATANMPSPNYPKQ